MKKIIAGLAILSTGYGMALLVPPDRVPLFKNLDLSLIKAAPKDVVDDLIEQVVIQKIIVAIMLAGMVVMSFAFSQQIKRVGNATGAN